MLTPEGTLVLVGPGSGQWVGPIARLLTAIVTSRFVGQRMLPFLSTVRRDDLLVLKDLIEAGKVRPVIDRSYQLSEIPKAIRYLEAGHAQGKVVITV